MSDEIAALLSEHAYEIGAGGHNCACGWKRTKPAGDQSLNEVHTAHLAAVLSAYTATLRDQVAAVEALRDEYGRQAREEGYGGELWSATEAAIAAALTFPGTALAKADALREVAEWLAETGFPIDFNWPDDPPPAPLRAALIDVIHADVDGRWHGGTLTHDEAAGWIISEAGWPDEREAGA